MEVESYLHIVRETLSTGSAELSCQMVTQNVLSKSSELRRERSQSAPLGRDLQCGNGKVGGGLHMARLRAHTHTHPWSCYMLKRLQKWL